MTHHRVTDLLDERCFAPTVRANAPGRSQASIAQSI